MKSPRGWLWRRWLTFAGYGVTSLIATYAIHVGQEGAAIAAIWSAFCVHAIYCLSATAEDITNIFKAAAEGLARAKDAADE